MSDTKQRLGGNATLRTRVAPQIEMGKAVAGESATTDIAKALVDYRRQPMSLKAAQEIDEALTKRITREYTIEGMTKKAATCPSCKASSATRF